MSEINADVNNDGKVDIHDVNEMTGALLKGDKSPEYDVNKDGRVDIGDLADTIDASLNLTPVWDGKTTVNGVTFKMIPVKHGTFTMGSPSTETGSGTNERPQHEVTLTKEYYIGETPVTQALWVAVMGVNPSRFTGDPNRPVERVSWNDCQAFITKLNEMTGRQFRLPTEAEWEFAARGGNKSQGFPFPGVAAPTDGDPKEYIWYISNAVSVTHPVAQKLPNELGLYDMGGNVFEWCQDWYQNPYPSSHQTDPTGPATGTWRVYRGGAYSRPVKECRSAYRYMGAPTFKADHVGLRLAL